MQPVKPVPPHCAHWAAVHDDGGADVVELAFTVEVLSVVAFDVVVLEVMTALEVLLVLTVVEVVEDALAVVVEELPPLLPPLTVTWA